VDNLQGLGPAQLGISVHRLADGSRGGLRIVLRRSRGLSELVRFRAHYRVTRIAALANGGALLVGFPATAEAIVQGHRRRTLRP
jgi:hypothetical protein